MMCHQISIEINLDSLTYSGQIIGEINFVIDTYDYFPGVGWSDFVAVILKWWIDSCRAILHAPLKSIHSFPFMDGPFSISAKKISLSELELSFTKDGQMKTEIGIVSIEELKVALIKATRQFINAVNRLGWENEDVDVLKHTIKSLEMY
ncbi:hypothetical protein [Exiguobacterium sp. BG5(2022)]|uniref:hypothetical protein n=1 Tax=Exiguobacterium sp. BG5(2022) TaxID=2962595 RepID=UPI0028829E2B|nr:hypothetical protein [Exiguobacterium sp. BG5(2022)]MDT0192908.1 hypothetical protein [Exiguobacterium sp. BG5(2022)]